MSGQASLFDVPAATAARDEALMRVAEHSTNEWVQEARAALRQVAETHDRFICDAVWSTGLRRPSNDNRALGSIMRWGAKVGLIVATDQYDRSAAVKSHRVPRVIWESRIYGTGI